MVADTGPPRRSCRRGELRRAAVGTLLTLFVASAPTTVVGAPDSPLALPCAEQLCPGNATCIVRVDLGQPDCIGRTKPGGCPVTETGECSELRLLCEGDDDCPGDKVCCQVNCERTCISPEERVEKRGLCPARLSFGPCVTGCSQDGECSGDSKCCDTGCGAVCSSPYVAKPGSCPAPQLRGASCAVQCSLDHDCPSDQKCCSNGCGRTCSAPSDDPLCPNGTTFYNKCNRCTCIDGKVECETNICAKEKSGSCPNKAFLAKLRTRGCGTKCYGDDDCPSDSKCCEADSCGPICTPPAEEKPGLCPAAEGQDRCGDFCDTDSDCPQSSKCCLTGCGRTCKPPDEPGFCPAETASPNCLFRKNECSSNFDCGKGQMCCDTSCGKKCSKKVSEKPGLCPNPDKLTLEQGVFCKSDHHCPRDLKCCGNKRGDVGCTQPTQYKTTCRNVQCTKPGYYCVDMEEGPECVNKPMSTCADIKCEENSSCLQRHDKAVCVPHTKVGQCPLAATPLRPCKKSRILCQKDEDCEGGNICCTAGCSRKCVKPLKTDCASIGNKLCETAGYICQDTPNGAVCVEDMYDCTNRQCPVGYICDDQFTTGARCIKARETCADKICAPGEECYEEEDGAICIQNYIAEGSINRETKAGRCPAIRPGSYRGDCQDECRYDSECPRQQRCCNNGCASVCLDPDFRRTCDQLTCPPGHVCVDRDSSQDAVCVDTAPKQTGRCPSPSLWDTRTRSCEEQCQYDSQCSGDQRCCSNGCALVCTAPDTRKLCDEISCEPGTACVESPTEDAQCFRTDEKFGLCPKLPATGSLGGGCQDTCRYDAQCADNTKCCNNGCASVCLAPRKPDCETTQCRVGFRCMQRRNGAPYCAAIPGDATSEKYGGIDGYYPHNPARFDMTDSSDRIKGAFGTWGGSYLPPWKEFSPGFYANGSAIPPGSPGFDDFTDFGPYDPALLGAAATDDGTGNDTLPPWLDDKDGLGQAANDKVPTVSSSPRVSAQTDPLANVGEAVRKGVTQQTGVTATTTRKTNQGQGVLESSQARKQAGGGSGDGDTSPTSPGDSVVGRSGGGARGSDDVLAGSAGGAGSGSSGGDEGLESGVSRGGFGYRKPLKSTSGSGWESGASGSTSSSGSGSGWEDSGSPPDFYGSEIGESSSGLIVILPGSGRQDFGGSQDDVQSERSGVGGGVKEQAPSASVSGSSGSSWGDDELPSVGSVRKSSGSGWADGEFPVLPGFNVDPDFMGYVNRRPTIEFPIRRPTKPRKDVRVTGVGSTTGPGTRPNDSRQGSGVGSTTGTGTRPSDGRQGSGVGSTTGTGTRPSDGKQGSGVGSTTGTGTRPSDGRQGSGVESPPRKAGGTPTAQTTGIVGARPGDSLGPSKAGATGSSPVRKPVIAGGVGSKPRPDSGVKQPEGLGGGPGRFDNTRSPTDGRRKKIAGGSKTSTPGETATSVSRGETSKSVAGKPLPLDGGDRSPLADNRAKFRPSNDPSGVEGGVKTPESVGGRSSATGITRPGTAVGGTRRVQGSSPTGSTGSRTKPPAQTFGGTRDKFEDNARRPILGGESQTPGNVNAKTPSSTGVRTSDPVPVEGGGRPAEAGNRRRPSGGRPIDRGQAPVSDGERKRVSTGVDETGGAEGKPSSGSGSRIAGLPNGRPGSIVGDKKTSTSPAPQRLGPASENKAALGGARRRPGSSAGGLLEPNRPGSATRAKNGLGKQNKSDSPDATSSRVTTTPNNGRKPSAFGRRPTSQDIDSTSASRGPGVGLAPGTTRVDANSAGPTSAGRGSGSTRQSTDAFSGSKRPAIADVDRPAGGGEQTAKVPKPVIGAGQTSSNEGKTTDRKTTETSSRNPTGRVKSPASSSRLPAAGKGTPEIIGGKLGTSTSKRNPEAASDSRNPVAAGKTKASKSTPTPSGSTVTRGSAESSSSSLKPSPAAGSIAPILDNARKTESASTVGGMQSSNGKPKTPIILPDIGDGYLPPASEFVPPKTGYYGQIPSIPFPIRRTPNKEPGTQTSTSGPSSSRPGSSITATGTSVAGSETPKPFGGKTGPATRPSDPRPSTTGSTSATATRGSGSVFEPSGPITPSADAGQAPGSSRRGTTNATSVSGSRDPGSETRTPGTVVSPGSGIRKPGSPSGRPKADKRPGSISASRNPESPNRIPESELESGGPVSTSGTLGSTSVSVKPGTKSRIPSNENNIDGARRRGPANRRPGSNIGTGTSTRPSKPILGIGRPKPDDSKQSGDQVGSGNPRAPNRRPSLSRPGSTAPGLVSEVGMPETIDKTPTSVIETGKPGSSGSKTDSVPGSARPGTTIGIPGPPSGNDKSDASNMFPKATSGKPGASINSARVTPGSGTNRRPAPVRKTTKPSGDDQSGIQPGLPGSSGGITTSDSTKRRPGFTVDSQRRGNDIPGSLSGTDQTKTNRIPGFVLQPGKSGERTPGSTSPGSTSRSPGSGTRTQSPGTSDRTPGIVQSSNKPSSTRDRGPGSVVGIGKTGSSIKTAEPAFGSRPGLTSSAGDGTSRPVQPGTASKTPLPSLETIQSGAPKRTPEAVPESSSPEAGSRAPLKGSIAGVSGRPGTGNRSPGPFGTQRGPGRVPVSSRPETDRAPPGRIGTDNSRASNRVSVPAKETGKPELSTVGRQRPVSRRPGTANRTPGSVAGKTETPSEVIQEAKKSKQPTRIPGLDGSSKKPGTTNKLPGSSVVIGSPGTTGSLGSVRGNNRPGLSVGKPSSVSSRPTAGSRTTDSVRGTNKPGAPNTRLTSISSKPGSTSTATRVATGPRESASGESTPSSVSGIGKFGRPRRPGSVAVPSKSSSGCVTPGSPSNPEISGSFDKDSEVPRAVSTGGKKTGSKDLPDIGDGYLPPDSEFTPPKKSYTGLPPSSGRPFNRSPSLLNKPETSTDPKDGNRPGQIVTSAQYDPKLRPKAVPTGQRIPPPSRQAGVLKRPIASKPLPEVPEKEPTGPDDRGREPPRRTTVNGKLPGSSQQKIPVPGRRRPVSVAKTKQEPNASVANPLPQRGTGTAPQRRPSRPVGRRPSVKQGSSGDRSSSQTPKAQQPSRGSLQSVSGRPTAADRPSVRPPANVSPQRVRPGLSSRRPASGSGVSAPSPVGQGPDSTSQLDSSRRNTQSSPQRQASRPTSGTRDRPSAFQAGGVSGPLRPRPVSRRPGSGVSEEPKQITSGGSSQRQKPRPINRRPSSAIGQVVATKPLGAKSPQSSRPGTRQPSSTRPTGVSQPTALSSGEGLRRRPVNGRPKPTGQRGETPESLPTRPLGGDGTGTAKPNGSVNEVSPQGPTSVPKSRPSFGRIPSSRPSTQTSPQRRPPSRAPVSQPGSIQTSSDPKPAAEQVSPARRPRPAYSRPASSRPAGPKQTAIPESRPDQAISPVLNQPKTPGIAESSISISPQRRPRPPYSQQIAGAQTDSSQTNAAESPEKQPAAVIRPSSSGEQQKPSSKPETSPQRKRPRPAYSRPNLPRQPSSPQTTRGQSPVSQKPGSSSRRPIASTQASRTPSTTGQSESPKPDTDAEARPDVPRRRPGAAVRRPIATGQEPGVPSRRPITTVQAGLRQTEGDREEKPGAPVRRPVVTGTTGSPEIEGTRGQRPGVSDRKPVVSGQIGSPELDEGTRGQRPGAPSRRPVASGRPEISGTVGDQVQTPVSPSRRPASTEQAGSPGTGGNQGQRPGGYNSRPVATGQSPSVPSRRPARPTAVEQTGSPGTEGSVGRRPGSPSRRPSNGQRVSPVTNVEKPGVKISRFDNILPGPTIQPVLVGSTDTQNLEPIPNKQSSRPDPKVSSRNQTSVTDSKRPGTTGQTFPSRPVSERPRRPLGRPDGLPSATETGRPDKRPTAAQTDSTRPSVGGTPPRRRQPLDRPQPGSPGQTVSPRPTSVGQPGRRPSQTQTSHPVDRQPTDSRPAKTSRPVTTASRSSTTTPLRPPSPFSFRPGTADSKSSTTTPLRPPSPFSFRPRTTASKSSTTTPLRPTSPFSSRPGTVDIVPSLVFNMLPPSEESFSGVQPGGSSGSSPGVVGSARPRDPESVGLGTRAPEPLKPSVIKAQNEGFFGYLPPPP